MSFPNRMKLAREHELTVKARIEAEGWAVAETGQGVWPEELRNALRRIDTPLRWLADLIAARHDAVYLVDAKAGTGPNHSIEQSSLVAHAAECQHYGLPVVFVWDDLTVSFVWDLLQSDRLLVGPPPSRGSGTPYYLWPRTETRPFGDVFGPEAETYGPPPEWRMQNLRRNDGAA